MACSRRPEEEDQFLLRLLATADKLKSAQLSALKALLDKYAGQTHRISTVLFNHLDPDEQERFVAWFLLRWGHISILPQAVVDNYRQTEERFRNPDFVPHGVGDKVYRRVNFREQGVDFDLVQYDWVSGIDDILFNQYEHKNVTIRPGDAIIDAGAFIGDTAVLFHHKAERKCRIHSFELLDENIALYEENLRINGIGAKQAWLNRVALSDTVGDKVFVQRTPLEGATKLADGETDIEISTTTIDHYVKQRRLKRIDFIKMDIEGSEPAALRGARNTIERFRPRLAICLYHQPSDVYDIPEIIRSFDVDYKFGFKWVNLLMGWEAVLSCEPLGPGASAAVAPEPLVTSDADTATPPRFDVETELGKALVNIIDEFAAAFDQAELSGRKDKVS